MEYNEHSSHTDKQHREAMKAGAAQHRLDENGRQRRSWFAIHKCPIKPFQASPLPFSPLMSAESQWKAAQKEGKQEGSRRHCHPERRLKEDRGKLEAQQREGVENLGEGIGRSKIWPGSAMGGQEPGYEEQSPGSRSEIQIYTRERRWAGRQGRKREGKKKSRLV